MNSEPPDYATAAAVAGLARELEGLRRNVNSLPTLATRIDNVADLVAKLAQDLANRKEAAPEEPATWLAFVDGITHARRLLTGLADWMGEVYLRYGDAALALPDCWLWHPDVVEELLWLRQAWQAAYHGDGASISRVGDWHDRQRPGVVRRIKSTASSCSIENHQPSNGCIGAPTAPIVGATEVVAAWWAARRSEAPPAPTPEQLAAASARTTRGST
ncbi:MAG: hypothetical protein M3042_07805 [Actinomycetota bacterium]|nr:hypothetical protein [Actinomycetota bacterium]